MASGIDSSVLSGINGTIGQTGKAANTQSGEMNDQFMTLLVTQLKNQDPMNPMENAEMTSQLAQINTVSGIEKLNSTLSSITDQINQGQALEAAGLVGSGVMVPGNKVLASQVDGDVSTTPFGIELDQPADNVRVTITNGAGQVVNQYDAGPVSAGVSSFSWDGQLTSGEQAPDGAYTVSMQATRDEKPIDFQSLNYAQVGAVTPQQNGSVLLDLGAVYGQIGMNDVKQIL
ncbi:flagellar hook assembly protein FlgD [Onishia niordana]|uniref:flagellar hook assembly protein FlgD n=1 Tax=Onishia niordana TaxID=2508711 RepID=UPI00109F39B3|nr:flagellar hook assembly protein FlgD [Halomonas niordiana]